MLDVDPSTRERYEGIIRVHIRPALGDLPLSKVDGRLLDTFYAQLRRCRACCEGKSRHVKHRMNREHACADRCVVVPCKPLSTSSIRAAHWILSATFGRAVR